MSNAIDFSAYHEGAFMVDCDQCGNIWITKGPVDLYKCADHWHLDKEFQYARAFEGDC